MITSSVDQAYSVSPPPNYSRLNANGFAISMNMIMIIGRKSQRSTCCLSRGSRILGWLMVDVDHKLPLKCGNSCLKATSQQGRHEGLTLYIVRHEGWTLYIHRPSSQLVGLT